MTRRIPLLGESGRESSIAGGRENKSSITIVKMREYCSSTFPPTLPVQSTHPYPQSEIIWNMEPLICKLNVLMCPCKGR